MISLPMHAWHPLIVHFPLGLLFAGVALEAAGWFTRRPSLRRAGLLLLTAGLLLALPAIASGLLAYGLVDHSSAAHQLMKLHRNLMLAALGLFLIAVVWRWKFGERVASTRPAAVLYAALLTTASVTLIVGADHGANLVYGHGTGLASTRLEEILRDRGDVHGHPRSGVPGEVSSEPMHPPGSPSGASRSSVAPADTSSDSTSAREHEDGRKAPHIH